MNRDRSGSARTCAVGVVVPVHDEQELLGDALTALGRAFEQLGRRKLELKVVLVLDDCHDLSATLARDWQTLEQSQNALEVTIVASSARNVGAARALGCQVLLAHWSQMDHSKIWIATTDADSQVPKDWLCAQVAQHDCGVDYWSGRVSVTNWSEHSPATRQRWQYEYDREKLPVHGANMGFNAAVYLSQGGFPALETGEDRALHNALMTHAVHTFIDSDLPVVTSARRRARAPSGFAHALEVVSYTSHVPVEA